MADRVLSGNANFKSLQRNSSVVDHATMYPGPGVRTNSTSTGGNPAVKSPFVAAKLNMAGASKSHGRFVTKGSK